MGQQHIRLSKLTGYFGSIRINVSSHQLKLSKGKTNLPYKKPGFSSLGLLQQKGYLIANSMQGLLGDSGIKSPQLRCFCTKFHTVAELFRAAGLALAFAFLLYSFSYITLQLAVASPAVVSPMALSGHDNMTILPGDKAGNSTSHSLTSCQINPRIFWICIIIIVSVEFFFPIPTVPSHGVSHPHLSSGYCQQ